MPRVTTAGLRVYDEGKVEYVDIRYDVSVNVEGEFTTTIPRDIADQFIQAGVSLRTNQKDNPGYFSDDTMEGLKSKIRETCKEYLSREITGERVVIRYIIQTLCSYCITGDGEIVPNGGWAEESDGHWDWKHGTVPFDSSNHHPFGIQVYAKPFIRKDYLYKSGNTQTDYTGVIEHHHGRPDTGRPNLEWLDGLRNLEEPRGEKLKEIDYTEEVAGFFVNLIKSICEFNEQVKGFLEPEHILIMAQGGKNLLNPGGE